MQRDQNSQIDAKPASTARASDSAEAVRDYRIKRSRWSAKRCCAKTEPPPSQYAAQAPQSVDMVTRCWIRVPCALAARCYVRVSRGACKPDASTTGVTSGLRGTRKPFVIMRLLSHPRIPRHRVSKSCGDHATAHMGYDATGRVRQLSRSRCDRWSRRGAASCRLPDGVLLAPEHLGPGKNSGNNRCQRESRQRHDAVHLRRTLCAIP